MRSRIIDTLQAKLKFLFHITFRVVGIFWCECKGDLGRCKLIADECITEYDNAAAAGFPLHRVARRLLAPGSVCRAELELWIRPSQPLSVSPTVYRMLLEYALCPFVERTIEAVHAMIKRVGLAAPNSTPPYVLAKIREPQTWDLLTYDAGFQRFALQIWNCRILLSDLLVLRYEEIVVKGMSRLTKIKSIYQCTTEDAHEDTADREVPHRLHLQLALPSRVQPVASAMWKHMVAYLKDLFVEGNTYSMPTEIFQSALDASLGIDDPEQLWARFIEVPLAARLGTVSTYVLQHSTIFVVTNTRPENRVNVTVPHLLDSRMTMVVSTCTLLQANEGEAIVHQTEGVQATLDTFAFIQHLDLLFRSTYHWSDVLPGSAVKERPGLASLDMFPSPHLQETPAARPAQVVNQHWLFLLAPSPTFMAEMFPTLFFFWPASCVPHQAVMDVA